MKNHKNRIIGVIGGSGIYDIEGLANKRWQRVESPFGNTSDEFLFGELGKIQMVFLPRHGRGHIYSPSEINYRANIDAMKRVGVTDLISVSAVGSLREHLKPGMFVIVDQFIDRTYLREKSFFGTGCVAHVSLAHPVCSRLGDHIEASAKDADLAIVRGGTYLVMEGPQFSTLAESELYRTWNCDVIGMTNMPEANLAREAELCYASVAMVTDYDCWHPGHDDVTVEQIVAILVANAGKAHSLVKAVAPRIYSDQCGSGCGCCKSLEHALITSPGCRRQDILHQLDAVAGRVLNK